MKDLKKKILATKGHYTETPYDFQYIREKSFMSGLTNYVLQNYDLAGKTIVDVGCSTSFNGQYILKHYPPCRYVGIDINPKAVRIAKENGLGVVVGDNLNLCLHDRVSDLTISEGVIHHTPDPFRAFKELIRVTKRGGLISLYVYHRHHYYFWVYRLGFPLRMLYKKRIGKSLIRRIVFPLFDRFYVQLGYRLHFTRNQQVSGALRSKASGAQESEIPNAPKIEDFEWKEKVPYEISWNIFSDQILTPIAHFFTRDQILNFAKNKGLIPIKEKKSFNEQGLMFIFKRSE